MPDRPAEAKALRGKTGLQLSVVDLAPAQVRRESGAPGEVREA
jgi:hypothetical protein